jgi:hypothetical protein
MTDKTPFIKLLRIVVQTIEDLDQDQIDQLVAGKAKLTFNPIRRISDANTAPSPPDHNKILERLNECKNREEARLVLNEITNKDSLAAIARALKVHVVKHDRREDIESKIIEFIIGGKLRTEAIRSLNLKGGGSRPVEE